ncbi:hypothetical protein FYK55_24450 [Roseiconus nitratireducens]|uniref:DUF2628 domain-containing protein n=1 Tax=Roseiconus nitratireducens TaxID=2605748 RepID=A0A5M6CX38_9BACT|nr:hypothetical protein [Roseiconus nitratireducens]KAA5539486.1 hypothetical protein FYK55_24450 [Roseiconus nitratireducens]
MRPYKVFRSPNSGLYQAVKIGFNWPAFFFTYFWMALTKVPRLGFPAFWSALIGPFALLVFGAAEALLDMPNVTHPLFLFVWFVYSVFVGMHANEWLACDKEQAGWDDAGTIEADSEYNAIQAAKRQ